MAGFETRGFLWWPETHGSAGLEIAQALQMNYVFFCEFEELHSPFRDAQSQVHLWASLTAMPPRIISAAHGFHVPSCAMSHQLPESNLFRCLGHARLHESQGMGSLRIRGQVLLGHGTKNCWQVLFSSIAWMQKASCERDSG